MPSSLQTGRSATPRLWSVGDTQADNRQRCDTLTPPHESDPLACGGLHIDASGCQAEGAGQTLPDRLTVWAKLGALHHDGAVHVDQLQSSRSDTRDHHLEQLDRVGIAIALVAVGEVLTDVAEAGRAKQGVDHCMSEHVGIGMTVEAELAWNIHATENQRAAPDEPVGVVADAGQRHATRTS